MVDTQMIDSFTECLDLQLFMQNYQEEKVKENQMFYNYLTTQLNILTQESGDDINKIGKQKAIKSPQLNLKNQFQKNFINYKRRKLFLEFKSILDIHFKQNLQYYIKWRELLKIFKDKLNHLQTVLTQKNQIYEIDLESQETRILIREYNDLKEHNMENKSNEVFDNLLKFDESIDSLFSSRTDEQDKIDGWIHSFHKKVDNNFIDAEFGLENIDSSEESFVNSFQSIFQRMNDRKQPDQQILTNQILEQNTNTNTNQKSKAFLSFFLQDLDKENNQNQKGNINDPFIIDIESKESNQIDVQMEEEQIHQIKQDQENLGTPQKSKDKNFEENGINKGPLTRSATKKLALISPEKNKSKSKSKSSTQDKGKQSVNIWNETNNISMNNAICITNSMEQENSLLKDNQFLKQQLLEIHSNSLSPKQKQIIGNKEQIYKRIIKKEQNTQIPQSQLSSRQQTQIQQQGNNQIKPNIQVLKKNEMDQFQNINQNNFLTQQQNQQIIVKKEFIQPIPKQNNQQTQQKNEKIELNEKNIIQDDRKYQPLQQIEIEKEVIIISPLETNIQSLSRLSSQLSLNNSCYIVREKKLGKKIIKTNKSPTKTNVIKGSTNLNNIVPTNQNQFSLKIQKRKIIRN